MVTRLVTNLLQNTPFLPFLLYSLLCFIVRIYIDKRILKYTAIRFIMAHLQTLGGYAGEPYFYNIPPTFAGEPLYPLLTPLRFIKTKTSPKFLWNSFAVRTGLEPVTPCVTGMYSNQLN